MKVKNKACIRKLSFKQFKAAKVRNIIATIAIALTTILFTSLFTIALSINDGFQQSNFRLVGGYAHGAFKYLTEEQMNLLKEDSLIKEYGKRKFIGLPSTAPFEKSHVEISYCDDNAAKWMFCTPKEGHLPKEGSNEAATDLKVLELLGVEPKIGNQFTIEVDVDGHTVKETFTLSGWWEYDDAIVANHVLIPQSRAEAILDRLGIKEGTAWDGITGFWNLDLMFSSSMNIEEKIEKVLENNGYQGSDPLKENYIRTGVNWGYTGSQVAQKFDYEGFFGLIGIFLLIIFTGYLIIYNVFQISVSNDIHFYGLLKTIGTTPKQIKSIVKNQALLLSIIGIPLGLLLGYFVGAILTPVVIERLNGVEAIISINPLIFAFAALFSLFTVFLSCLKPSRIAGQVTPVEALRYTEVDNIKGKSRKGDKVTLLSMAFANLNRSRKKTLLSITSLSLAVVLLCLAFIFSNGFDMDKYLRDNVITDFVVAHNSHMVNSRNTLFSPEKGLKKELFDSLLAQGEITEGGVVYGKTKAVLEFINEEYFRYSHRYFVKANEMDEYVGKQERNEKGLIQTGAQLFGMDEFNLNLLDVFEGDISALYDENGNAIAAVYATDDYGNLAANSHWAKLGDVITLRYCDAVEYYDPTNGKIYGSRYEDIPNPNSDPWEERITAYHDVEYVVKALVTVPKALSYRYFGSDEFVLNSKRFIKDSGTDSIMLFSFNTRNSEKMEEYLANYTENINPEFAYESRGMFVEDFYNFKRMFNLLGLALSFIVTLIGLLNYFNTILTSIISRRREFAVLQAVGMSRKQLGRMLSYEGLILALSAGGLSLLLSLILSPIAGYLFGRFFWFFTYRFTILPVLVMLPLFALIGAFLPLIIYRFGVKSTIVERLRCNE